MSRAFPKEIAEATGLHPNTVRALVDKGLLDAERDYNGWRWFPRPEKTIQQVQDLIYGRFVDKELRNAEADSG